MITVILSRTELQHAICARTCSISHMHAHAHARLGLLYSVSSVGAQLRDNITLTVMATSSSSTAES